MKKLFLGLIGIMMSIFLIGCGGEKEVETTENTKKLTVYCYRRHNI